MKQVLTMKSKTQLLFPLLLLWTAIAPLADAQTSDIKKMFHDLEAKAPSGAAALDEADPVLERLSQASKESVSADLPLILREAGNPHYSVRRVAISALFAITMRPDGRALLSRETTTFAMLLTDRDIPIKRMTGLAINNLQLGASSPLVPVLEAYLAREDAVSTIGAGVAGLLMQAAPLRADSTSAVVQFMKRQDQTTRSRLDTLQSIQVAKSSNREIGKEVAAYADDIDEDIGIRAIQVLQGMGKSIVHDNQQSLSRIAADTGKPAGVRAIATKALSAVQ